MCCILACFNNRPSLLLLRNIEMSNRDGFGVAWLDRDQSITRWRKGMQTAEECFDLTQELPLPFIVHARFATAGGNSPQLTHPFPIEHKPSLALAGKAHRVLAHNGHVADYMQIARVAGIHLPKHAAGWSDTRVIAALIARKGEKVLQAFQDKFALLSIHSGLRTFGQYHVPEGSPGIMASSSTRPAIYIGHYGAGYEWGNRDDEVSVTTQVSQSERARADFDEHAERVRRDAEIEAWCMETGMGAWGRD